MFRSYVVVWMVGKRYNRRDFVSFAQAIDLYSNCVQAQLFGVDRDDKGILLGERCNNDAQ